MRLGGLDMRDNKYKNLSEYDHWVTTLSNDEKMQCSLLDAYFAYRDNRKLKDSDAVCEPKTSAQIADDLHEMYDGMDIKIIYHWMELHGFSVITLEDGSVAWCIWRDTENF